MKKRGSAALLPGGKLPDVDYRKRDLLIDERNLLTDGVTETAMTAIAQRGIMARRVPATILYREMPEGTLAIYTDGAVTLNRAVERLKTNGCIQEMAYE